jgi:hypothetical protein
MHSPEKKVLGADSWFSDFIKTALMNELQQRVTEAGVCPSCHAKTLRVRHEALGMSFEQCERCLIVYVLPCGVA